MPSASPTRDSRASVVGPTTRARRRSRSAPSSPPRSTYPIFCLRLRPDPWRPTRLPPCSVAPLQQVEIRRPDQILVANVQRGVPPPVSAPWPGVLADQPAEQAGLLPLLPRNLFPILRARPGMCKMPVNSEGQRRLNGSACPRAPSREAAVRILLINPPYQTLTSNLGVGHQVPLGLLAVGGPLRDAG